MLIWLKHYRPYLAFAVFILLSAFFCFHDLGRLPLAEWDEQTNVRVVRASLGSGQPLDLHLNGQPFFEKTPLWYYATESSVLLLGDEVWSYRLVSALAGFLLTISIALTGWKLWNARTGVLAGALLLSIPHLWVRNTAGYFSTHTFRSADVDALLLFFMFISWAAAVLFVKRRETWDLAAACLFGGLAVMAKGPIGLLPLVVFGIRKLGSGRETALTRRQVLPALSIFLLIVLPWYLWMYGRFGDAFVDQHFGYHLLGRIGMTLENHSEHWWFYLKLLADPRVFPGCVWLVLALRSSVMSKRWKQDYLTFSLTVMVITSMALLTITQTRIAWYVLPVYPFAALLMAEWVARQKSWVQVACLGTIAAGIGMSLAGM